MSPSWNTFSAAARISDSLGDGYVPSSSPSSAGSVNSSQRDIETRVEKQNLIIQTLLMILLEKKVIHEDEFKEWMIYVDELDGKRDGKLSEDKAPVLCPKCKRNNPRHKPTCQYCGEEFPPEFLMHVRDKKPGP